METIHCPICSKKMISITDPATCPNCDTAQNSIPEKSGAPWPLEGRGYVIKVDGTRSLNGKLAGYTMWGEIEQCHEGDSVWDVLRAIITKAEEDLAKVEHVRWITLELRPNKSLG